MIAICDDDTIVTTYMSERIKTAFTSLDLDISIQTFSSIESLKAQMLNCFFDVFFLDIDMPESDGIDFGISLRNSGSDACIVFVSNREERVYDSFKVAPVRFIRKSMFNEEIDEAAKVIGAWWEQRKNKYLVLSSRGQVNSIPIDDILYVESFDKVQNIVTRTQTKTVRITISELEDKLLNHGFLCPHKGFLVNYRFIDSIETADIVLKNGELIPISKYKIVETKRTFMKLVFKEPAISEPRLFKP